MKDNNKILVVGVEPDSLIYFRGNLLQVLVEFNLSVTTISKPLNTSQKIKLENFGVDSKNVEFSRSGLNPISDIKTIVSLFFAYKKIRPKIILCYTIKPVIWGGIVSKFFKQDFYALITGLGFSFQGDSFKRKVLTKLVTSLYKVALKSSKAVIFQNEDNLNVFVDKGIVPRSKAHVVNGSGVDIEKYSVVDFPKMGINFLCISRLLSEKGLREYAIAAKIVKDIYPAARFSLVGPEDSSPDAISLTEVNSWSDYISYKGSSSDVREYIKGSNVYVLPSYHEGLPRSTLEAMSMGRPILTTDAAGCRETVEEGVNGFKVKVKSPRGLADKMIWFIENRCQIESMGLESRRIVEDKFDVHKVNKEMLKIMGIT